MHVAACCCCASAEPPSQRSGRTSIARTLARKSRETRDPQGPEGSLLSGPFFVCCLPAVPEPRRPPRRCSSAVDPSRPPSCGSCWPPAHGVAWWRRRSSTRSNARVRRRAVTIVRRAFAPADLDGVWLVVAAATPDVNRQVADAAEARRVFVNAVDDPANAIGVLERRRSGATASRWRSRPAAKRPV